MFHWHVGIRAIAITALVFLCIQNARAAEDDVGSPAFKTISSNTMSLKYGFMGASVYDNSLKKWVFQKLAATITRHKVEGYVNQVNDSFALAAGLYEVAIYDYGKHKWIVRDRATPDDSTGELNNNFVLTGDYAEVALLNGPRLNYTSAVGWVEKARR